ncbi:MAG: radical SAM protein, partial [Thermodesulfobacteriota bacterium]|nr:radical SAM protein [Thermodesulfobacteriota bacterium]
DLFFLARMAVSIGIEKIRLTGGEPLLRKGIVRLLSRLGEIPSLKKLVLSTNGLLLRDMAEDLRQAGVESLNISLDSLIPERFARITGGGRLGDVLEGIEEAERAGFPHIKINVVVMRGINDDEVLRFASLTGDRRLTIRFIEHMPLDGKGCGPGLTVPGDQILEMVRGKHRIFPLEPENLGGPARYYRMEGAAGTIGIITPVSCHFCGDCNRIRVTSKGIAKGCLFSPRNVDLKPLLAKRDVEGLRGTLRYVVGCKPPGHLLPRGEPLEEPVDMSRIGG